MGEEPQFLKSEIHSIVKQLKSNKSPGHDNITNEHIKMGVEKIITQITKLFNKILSSGRIPLEWKLSDIIILFKKGGRHKVTNYRLITLSPVIAKIFSKAIKNRIRLKVRSHLHANTNKAGRSEA